jgi:DNA polymerase III epsilon subunit-like protein
MNAKPFHETVYEVMHRIENRILVAHNYDFDGVFLASEFNRAGIDFNPYNVPYFCTQKSAMHFMPKLLQYSLAICLKEAGLTHDGKPHDAESDAITTASLLKYYIDMNKKQVLKLVLPEATA